VPARSASTSAARRLDGMSAQTLLLRLLLLLLCVAGAIRAAT
jgi:hypothetical protein